MAKIQSVKLGALNTGKKKPSMGANPARAKFALTLKKLRPK